MSVNVRTTTHVICDLCSRTISSCEGQRTGEHAHVGTVLRVERNGKPVDVRIIPGGATASDACRVCVADLDRKSVV